MKPIKLLSAIIALFLLFGCTRTSELYRETGNTELKRIIDRTIHNSGLNATMGIKVVSLKTGKTLYSLNSDHLFTPASNNKLYTASAALKYLTPQYKFETTVWIDSTHIDSSRIPRLVLRGGGDPDLSVAELTSLAEKVSDTIKTIDTLIIDHTLLDTIQLGPGWMWDEGSHWYAARVNALSLNDNCVDITLTPGKIGIKPDVTIFPPTNYVEINNQSITVNDTIDFIDMEIERRWWEDSNILDITGEILADKDKEIYYRNVEKPALFTGTVFKELLHANNITINTPIVERCFDSTMVPIFTHQSKQLSQSVMNFLKASDNLSGELYVKMIGYKTSGEQGSWINGLYAIKTFLKNDVLMDTTQIRIADGSGISRYNLTSPDQLTQLLVYIYKDHTLNAEFLSALSTGGWDGTLRNRMQSKKLNRSIRAKTGTLSGVSCLSGYAFTDDGEPLAFSIMTNGFIGSANPYRQIQDDICEILVDL